jgi:hypothetical protein
MGAKLYFRSRQVVQAHDDKLFLCHGRTTLFAALNVADGTVFVMSPGCNGHQDRPQFLKLIKRQMHSDRQVHFILESYATHEHVKLNIPC